MSEIVTKDPRCPECGAPITRSAPRGLCSRCLVTNALSIELPSVDEDFSLRPLDDLNSVLSDFKVERLLGRGGMGAVYEARQESLARSVALKLLPPELLQSEDFFDRFQREARIMAQMDHPNVARVFGNGITEDGQAYIAMELIRGEPVTSYVAAKRCDLRQRLELFVQVCSGVQHAHQKGIIHRDLKPSNILVAEVDGRPVPKVIDFGLAKPIEQSAGDAAEWLSARHAVGTPAYMSPEQAAGAEIDSRSDIYSLGALLYELLTGRPPFDDPSLSDASRSAIEEILRTTPVPRPSDAVSNDCSRASQCAGARPSRAQKHLKSRLVQSLFGAPERSDVAAPETGALRVWKPAEADELRGDLDAIVLKALAKDPIRRYQAAAALPEDIERFLTHQPVTAVSPTPAYLAKKLCRRHQVSLVVASGILLLLLAGVGLIIRESVLTHRAERLAGNRLRQGERLIEFILGDLHAKLQTVGRLDVLESAVGEVEQFYAQPGARNLPPESLRNRGRAMLQLGRIRNAQGKAVAAKTDYEESIRLYKAALSGQPNITAWKEELGQSWNSLAVFHHMRGEWAPAEVAYREALRLADDLLGTDPNHRDWADFKASMLHNFASLCEANSRLDEAEESYMQALQLWKPLQERAPDNVQLLEHLSHLYLNLAFLQKRRGQLDEGDESNAEALTLRERILELDNNNIRALELLADIQQNIAHVHINRGKLDEAEELMNRYRPVREQLANRDPANAEWQHKFADAWRNHGVLQFMRSNLTASAEAHRRAWEISERQLPVPRSAGTPRARWFEGLQAADPVFSRLAQQAKDRGDLAAAQQHWQTLVQIRAKLASETLADAQPRHELALASLELASACLASGDRSRASAHTALAQLLLEGCIESGFAPRLGEEHWKVLRELSGASNRHLTSSDDPVRSADLGVIDAAAAMAALDTDAFRFSSALAAALREKAAARVGKPVAQP